MNRNTLYFVGCLALLFFVMTNTHFWQSTSVWTHVRAVQENRAHAERRVTLRASDSACVYIGTMHPAREDAGLLDRLTSSLSFGRASPWRVTVTRATCFTDDGQLTHGTVGLTATGVGRLKEGEVVILAPAEGGLFQRKTHD
jgi:hypothetical protein